MSLFWCIKRFFRDIFYDIKYGIQRWNRGYSDGDLFNMCYWFPEVVGKMLKQLREQHAGYPCDMTNEQYEDILDKMILLSQYMHEDGEEKAAEDLCIKSSSYYHTVDELKRIDDLILQKKDEFFKIFSEIYFNLWD